MKRNLQAIASKNSGWIRIFSTVFVLSGILLFSPELNAQWNRQSPVPTYLDVRGIAAPTADRVFIATDNSSFDNGGALFESNDGGVTWVQRDIPLSLNDPFNGIFFLDSLNGWVYGNDNYRTIDGGTNWQQLPFLGSTYFMEFYSTSFGITTGNFGRYVSYDGGLNWVPSPNGIFSFDFIDDTTGLGVSDTAIFRTTDGGNTFSLVFSGNAVAVKYLTASVVIGIANDTLIRSADGGQTWTMGIPAEGRDRLQKVSGNVILAWGRSGPYPNYDDRIFRSGDAGISWTDLGEVVPDGVQAVTAVDTQSVVIADLAGNMFHSADAGLNWTLSFNTRGQQPSFLSSVEPVFADGSTGYFGYGAGFLIKSVDGGSSWTQISSGTGESLNDIDRFPGGNMIAVGEGGTLLRSNGSSPWTLNEVMTTLDLKAVQAISASEAMVIDQEGRVYTSADTGATWMASPDKPVNLQAEDAYFTSLQDGWVTGMGYDTSSLYHTTDGGATWTPVANIIGAYTAVDVVGTNIWAANVGGIFYKSSDAGATWTMGQLPSSPILINDMDFYNESIGYAVGWWGQAFRSTDGGLSWEMLQVPGNNVQFTDIYLVGANELWLSTTNDQAFYTANGGQNWSVMEIGSAGFGSFSAIAANPAGDAWTVGDQGYIEYFDGPPPSPLNLPPVSSFSFVTIGLTADFTDSSYDLDGVIVSWEWDFGDGATSALQNPSHTYDTANSYIVTLTVTDDDGDTGVSGQLVVVQPAPGGTFGDFTEVTPYDSVFVTPQDEDFWVISTAPADYDNDGDLDIAVLGYYVVYYQSVEEKLVLINNEGPSSSGVWQFSYTNVPLGDLYTGSSDLAWGDLDGDNDLDLAIGTNGSTEIYRNDTGTLVMIETSLPGYWEDNDQAFFDLQSITWADYDNDGDMDLLIPSVFNDSTYTFSTALMRNDGPIGDSAWNFTQMDSLFAATSHAQSSWADFDGDQDLDLLLVNHAPLMDEGFIRRYRNDGDSAFVGEDILSTLAVEHGEVQWGDYDGDGDLDILVAGNVKETDSTYTPMVLRIYQNDADVFTPFDVIACIPCEGWYDLTAATWADYDSDGDMDILLAGTYNSGSQIEGRATIYTNDNGVFTESLNELPAPRASGDRGGTFSWFDLDNDGDLDYFIAGEYFVPGGNGLVEAQMHVYRNDVTAQNDAPTVPTGLDVVVEEGGMVRFSWNPSTDDHTPTLALTYDFDLYLDNVPVNYSSRLPAPGNVSAVTEWLLDGLEDGTYQWTIQAVDASYSGSAVASGQFSIGIPTAVADNEYSSQALVRNYPNPFHASTFIHYQVEEDGPVMLSVYNLFGQEIEVLVNEYRKAGNYTIRFDGSGLPAGIYVYSLKGMNHLESGRMLLVK